MSINERSGAPGRAKSILGLAVVLAAIVGALPLLAQTPDSGAGIVIAARIIDETVNPSFLEIIELAASLRLARQGYGSRVLARAAAAALHDPASVLSGELSAVRYLLLAEVSARGPLATLRLAWFDADAGRWMAEIERTGQLDVSFDETIFRAMDGLLEAVHAASPENPIAAAPPSGPVDVSSAAPNDSVGVTVPGGSGESGILPIASPLAGASAASGAAVPNGLHFGLGAGAFLAGGELSQYFDYAGGIDVKAVWYFPGRLSFYGIGLSISGIAFSARGPLESGFGLLAPIALEFRVGAAGEGAWYFLHLSGGAELLYLRPELYSDRFGVLPFAAAGLGLTKLFWSGLGLTIDISYLVALDGTDLISGFNPVVGITIPLRKRP